MFGRNVGCKNVEDVDTIVHDILFSNEYIVNRLVTDIDELSRYRDQLKDMISKVDSSFVDKKALSKNDRFSNIVHGDPPSFATIKRFRVHQNSSTQVLEIMSQISSTRTLPINRSALGNVTTFGWKHIFFRVLEVGVQEHQESSFDRLNEGRNERDSTRRISYLEVSVLD
ncbi:hypothetical protein E3N88_35627 [Mikania micrantha]|uniref:Uncharacterized protein n=1 Tax=Mikania micrantha TaxID=192012 RepID=A0A5N6M1J8_9ASTR|nr:hypothetical protein E3N88_35627 [Mikania micrantha]